MMAFILATDFDFIAYMSKMAFLGKLFSRQWRFWNKIISVITETGESWEGRCAGVSSNAE